MDEHLTTKRRSNGVWALFAITIGVGVVLACGGSPDYSVRPLDHAIAPAVKDPPDAGPTEATALPQRVSALEPVTCRWFADNYESGKSLSLRTSWEEKGEVFATVTRAAKLDVTFSETNVDVFALSFIGGAGAFSMRGILLKPELPFYPKKARVIEEYFVPSPAVPFAKTHLEPSGRRAVIDLTCAGVEPGATLTTEWPCEEIALLADQYNAEALLPKERIREASLARRAIPLSTTPKGAPAATLQPDRAPTTAVTVTETDGDRSRIVWRGTQCAIFGWVASKDLVAKSAPAKAKTKTQPAPPTPAKPAAAEPAIESRTCKASIPLVARNTVVGELLPDRPIEVAEQQTDGFSRLVLPSANPTAETHFLVRTSDLELCAKKVVTP